MIVIPSPAIRASVTILDAEGPYHYVELRDSVTITEDADRKFD